MKQDSFHLLPGGDVVLRQKILLLLLVSLCFSQVVKAEVPADVKSARAALTSWKLGIAWATGSWGHTMGTASTDEVIKLADRSSALAGAMGVKLQAPPDPSKKRSTDLPTAVGWLAGKGSIPVAEQIGKNYDEQAAATFLLAVRSRLVLVMYSPKGPFNDELAKAIPETAERAKLPKELWMPLLSKINQNKPTEEIKTAIDAFDQKVEEHLSAPLK